MRFQGKNYVVANLPFKRTHLEPNPVGAEVLSFVQSSPPDRPVEDLIAQLVRTFEVDEATLRGDVEPFIRSCIERDILVNEALELECDQVLEQIEALQAKTEGLDVSGFGHCATWGGELTEGCQSCARGKWAVFNVGNECNLDCEFCPIPPGVREAKVDEDRDPQITFLGIRFKRHRELKLHFSLMKDQFDAFAWIGGETLLPARLDRLLELIRYFHETYPDYHQWIYTNGVYATPERMQALYDVGIREIRFNLAATGFAPKVLARLVDAKRIFDSVCVEIPMLERTFEGLMENIGTILDAGVDQLNLAEYMVSEQGLASRPEWLREEGALYNYKGFITSPISSRRYTYRVIERANEERWPIAINDCSNEYKYYKLCVQENKATRVFQGRPNYWGNTYKLCAVDRWNDESTS